MPCSAEMGVAESHYRRVVVLIPGTVRIDFALVSAVDIMGNGIGVRGDLDCSERGTGPRETVSHSSRSDHRIDISADLGPCCQ